MKSSEKKTNRVLNDDEVKNLINELKSNGGILTQDEVDDLLRPLMEEKEKAPEKTKKKVEKKTSNIIDIGKFREKSQGKKEDKDMGKDGINLGEKLRPWMKVLPALDFESLARLRLKLEKLKEAMDKQKK